MEKRTAKLGLIQVSRRYDWSVEECQEEMLYLTEQCLKEGADLVFLPEGNQYKGVRDMSPQELIMRYAAEYKERYSQLAKAYDSYVVPWDYELAEDGSVYNISYILDRQGIEIGKYRKVHLPYGEEFAGFARGKDFPVFDLDFGKVGIMICFDNYWPESAQILALRGAELILFPLYGDTLAGEWDIKVRARAIDNTVYVAPCHIHSAAPEGEASYTGLVNPYGEVVCKLIQEGSCQVVEFEPGKKKMTCTSAHPGRVEDIREYLLRARNPGAYGPILEEREALEWKDIIVEK